MLTTLTWPGLGMLALIACVVGAVNAAVDEKTSGTFVVSVFLALVGAIAGPWIARAFNLAELINLRIDDQPFPLVSAAAGAALAVVVKHFTTGRRLLRN